MSKTTAYFNINYFLKDKTSHNLKIYTAVTSILQLSKLRLQRCTSRKQSPEPDPCLPADNPAL